MSNNHVEIATGTGLWKIPLRSMGAFDASCFEMGAWQFTLILDQGTGLSERIDVPLRILIELMILRGVIKYPPRDDR